MRCGGNDRSDNEVFKIACINVGGRLGNIQDEMRAAVSVDGILHGYDVIAILDTRLTYDKIPPPRGYAWLTCCDENAKGAAEHKRFEHKYGVGMWIREGLHSAEVVEILAINERRSWVRIGCGVEALYIAFVYAPTQGSNAASVARFWDVIGTETRQYQLKGQRTFIMGDLNGRVGEVVGDSDENSNGNIIKSFCSTHNMAILNTSYTYGQITWRRSVTADSGSIIDYVLADTSVMDGNTIQHLQVIDSDLSDHNPITLWLRVGDDAAEGKRSALNKHSKANEERVSRKGWRIPRDPQQWEKSGYERHIRSLIGEWIKQHHSNVEEAWQSFKRALARAADWSFGRRRAIRQQRYYDMCYDPEVAAMVKQKRDAWKRMKSFRGNGAPADVVMKYRRLHNTVSRLVRRRKKVEHQRRISKLEKRHKTDYSGFHSDIRALQGKKVRNQIPDVMRTTDGRLIEGKEECIEHCAEYYERQGQKLDSDRYNRKFYEQITRRVAAAAADDGGAVSDEAKALNTEITAEELHKAISQLQNGKAADPIAFVNEMIKQGGETLKTAILMLLRLIWQQQHTPDDWQLADLVPLWKRKGSKGNMDNYRPIALMSVLAKTYETVIHNRVEPYLERLGLIGDEQAGFRKQRETHQQGLIITETVASRLERRQQTVLCFLDITKAYDLTWRDGILSRLLDLGISGHIWMVVKDMYRGVRNRVIVNGRRSRQFPSHVGVRQGSVLSPLLFSIFISGVIDEWKRNNLGVTIRSTNTLLTEQEKKDEKENEIRIAGLLFADDIVLMADNVKELRKALKIMEEHADKWRYKFNGDKCCIMIAGAKSVDETREWQIQGQPIKEYNHYKYLGIELDPHLQWHRWTDDRAAAGKRCLPMLWWCGVKQGGLATEIGNKLMDMMLKPAMAYGYEFANPSPTRFQTHERVQAAGARQLLRAPIYTKFEALRGELGWWTMLGQMHQRQLGFYHRLQSLPHIRLVHRVLAHRMEDARRRHKANESLLIPTRKGIRRRKNKMRTYGFCHMIRKTLQRYDLADHYNCDTDIKRDVWKKMVNEAIQRKEVEQWKHCLDSDAITSPAARFYNKVKKGWGYEQYLNMRVTNEFGIESHRSSEGRKLRTQMRTWSAPLAAILHRVGRTITKTMPPSPICVMCNTNTDETPTHLTSACPAYHAHRNSLFRIVEEEWQSGNVLDRNIRNPLAAWKAMDDEQKAVWLLSYDNNKDVVIAVNNYLFDAVSLRSKTIKMMSKQDQRSAAILNTTAIVDSHVDFCASNPL